jgi:hypothetical protein
MSEVTVEQEIKQVSVERSHVVILGAGASRAAFPSGDRNGRILPVMADLTKILEIEPILSRHSITSDSENFELLYSRLHNSNPDHPVLRELDSAVARYFGELELPDCATIYDHLLLSLRSKDIVATFNWDPFLMQAYYRNYGRCSLPKILFLHGSVAVAFCPRHKVVRGKPTQECHYCKETLTPSRLLYPVTNKDYANDPFIEKEWSALKHFIKDAFALTIFGYGAPATDVEAVELMKSAWTENRSKEFNQTEIIDILGKSSLESRWSEFTFSHHYDIAGNFYDSWIARHPRRSCEAYWNQNMEAQFIDNNPLPKGVGFDELYAWLNPLINAEKTHERKRQD